jgi:acyl-CoA thioester hydrolase
MDENPKETRARYPHVVAVPTRWADNDIYGHVNNAVYYAYFDTAINRYLIDEGRLDIVEGAVFGLCVESHCAYKKPIAFPDVVTAGLRVGHLGRTSVRYEIGIFARGEDEASAYGWFVHVFVDRQHRRPAPIPEPLREALRRLVVGSAHE